MIVATPAAEVQRIESVAICEAGEVFWWSFGRRLKHSSRPVRRSPGRVNMNGANALPKQSVYHYKGRTPPARVGGESFGRQFVSKPTTSAHPT